MNAESSWRHEKPDVNHKTLDGKLKNEALEGIYDVIGGTNWSNVGTLATLLSIAAWNGFNFENYFETEFLKLLIFEKTNKWLQYLFTNWHISDAEKPREPNYPNTNSVQLSVEYTVESMFAVKLNVLYQCALTLLESFSTYR